MICIISTFSLAQQVETFIIEHSGYDSSEAATL